MQSNLEAESNGRLCGSDISDVCSTIRCSLHSKHSSLQMVACCKRQYGGKKYIPHPSVTGYQVNTG